MRSRSNLTLVVASMFSLAVCSAEASPEKLAKKVHGSTSCISCHTLTNDEANQIIKPFKMKTLSIKPSPSGMHEVFAEGDGGRKAIFFVSQNKKYLVAGQILDLRTMKPAFAHANQMPKPPEPLAKIDIAKAPIKNAVTIGNVAGKKHLYVFTDPDCPYCRQLHGVLNKLVEIEPEAAVHIMLMPIPQLHPNAFEKTRAIFVSKSKQVLDDAFAGKQIPKITGDAGKAEIEQIVEFAKRTGINGTPYIFLENGKVYTGSRSAEEIKKAL